MPARRNAGDDGRDARELEGAGEICEREVVSREVAFEDLACAGAWFAQDEAFADEIMDGADVHALSSIWAGDGDVVLC